MNEHARRALSLVGTPFRHQGRLPGVGLDCLGVVVFTFGIIDYDIRDYHRLPDARELRNGLDMLFRHLEVDHVEDAPEGSVLAFATLGKRAIRHLGIRTPAGFVHADEFRVREVPICWPWTDRFEGAYAWRN